MSFFRAEARIRPLRAAALMAAALLAVEVRPARAAESAPGEVEQLKRLLEQQEQSIRELRRRIQQLEAAQPAAVPGTPPPVPAAVAPVPPARGEPPSPAEVAEATVFRPRKIPVAVRGQLDDRQEAAARPADYVLDPDYRGFIPIPNTVFLVKFNPKPRLDMMFTTRNPGDAKFRFVTANLPIESEPAFGSSQFNGTSNGSQLRVDLRAPSLAGNFRLYYQNDFFGDDTRQMRYRLQHFYGQYRGVVGGFTYSVFEDPDSWPDTVDYEGPNALIFARRAVLQYVNELAPGWTYAVGVEEPGHAVDTTGDPDASTRQVAPDVGLNVRWMPGETGHLQASVLLRTLGVRAVRFDDDRALGWGLNLSGTLNATDADLLQFLAVYGAGIGGLGNDAGFHATDAAFDGDGDLAALEYLSVLGAYTHRWTSRWRSTATFGFVKVNNRGLQAPTAYHLSHYGSLNLMYQLFKRLVVGVEELYGFREVRNGDDSRDIFRFNFAAVYSPFD